MIPNALNLPAQSFYLSLPVLVQVFASVPLIVFYCSHSNGRGPRAAGWYADALQDYLNLSNEATSSRVKILQGGIAAWEVCFGQGSLEHRGSPSQKSTVQL